ncbi:hypothetical protein ACWGCW_06855 [Streptomyces sp. NPDC054933]
MRGQEKTPTRHVLPEQGPKPVLPKLSLEDTPDKLPLGLTPPWLTMTEEEFAEKYRTEKKMSTLYLSRTLVRALSQVLAYAPEETELRKKPLLLEFDPPSSLAPLPKQLRFYIFNATQNAGERKQDAFKIQLTTRTEDMVRVGGKTRYKFSRNDDIWPILIGYYAPLDVYVLWDADLHDAGQGFSFSNSVYAPPEVVYSAAAKGLAETEFRRPKVSEAIAAARGDFLAAGVQKRIQLTIERALDGT